MFLQKLIKYNFGLFLPDCVIQAGVALLLFSCGGLQKKTETAQSTEDSATSCMMVPSRFGNGAADSSIAFNGDTSVNGMVFIKGGDFMMGSDNSQASADEYPKHAVRVNDFWMDATEVTNAEFAKFVEATHYITTAEKKTGLG